MKMSDLPLFKTQQGEEIDKLKARIEELEKERDELEARLLKQANLAVADINLANSDREKRDLEQQAKGVEEFADSYLQDGGDERNAARYVEKLKKQGLENNSSCANAIGYRQCLKYLNSKQKKEDKILY